MMRLLTLCGLVALLAPLRAQDCNAFLFLGSDTTICAGANIQLSASGLPAEVLSYDWTPSGLTVNPDNVTATDAPGVTTTYGLEVRYLTGPELVFNGDFSQGDTGFSTDYAFGNSSGGNGPLDDEGQYRITNSPPAVHDNFGDCGDHTSGAGNMMVVNGSDSPIDVWCQTIAVEPGIEYAFSAWVNTMVAENPAVLQFSINGQLFGDPFPAPLQICEWDQFFALWSSGASNSAEICIRNLNVQDGGNDFAIDDISFRRTCLTDAQRTVTVEEPARAEIDLPATVCQNEDERTLTEILTTESTPGGEWTLDGAPVDPSFRLSFLTTGTHTLVYRVGLAECSAEDTQIIEVVNPANPGVAIDEGLYCQGQNGTFALFDLLADFDPGGSWSLPAELTGIPFSPISGVADLSGTSAGSYDFTYTVGGANACAPTSSVVTVEVAPTPTVATPLPDVLLDCSQTEILLDPGVDQQFNVVWSRNGTPISNEQTLLADEAGDYRYELTDPASGCTASFELRIDDQRSEPDFSLMLDSLRCTPENELTNGRIEFVPAAGGNAPFLYSIDGQNFQAEPVFEELEPGSYQLVIEDAGGCRAERTITFIDPQDFSFDLSTDAGPDLTYGEPVSVFLQTNLPVSELGGLIWRPVGIADLGARSLTFILEGPLSVQANLTTTLGCSFNAQLDLSAQAGQLLFAPTAFSPNDDGRNDRWLPFGGPSVDRLTSVQIFDRWGSPVFQTEDQRAGDLLAGWDGRVRGQEAPVGVYAYAVEVILSDGSQQRFTGSITLVR